MLAMCDTVRENATAGGGRNVRVRAWMMRVPRSRVAKAVAVALLVAAVIIALRGPGWLQPLELAAYDRLRVSWAGHDASDRVLLVGISESDIRRWGYPVRDADLADLLERLAAAEPRVIGVDLIRDMPVPPGGDKLAEVLARHPNIVWVSTLKGGDDPGIPPPEPLRGTDRAVLADIPADPGNVIRRGLLYADDGAANYAGMGTAVAAGYLARRGISVDIEADNRLRLGERAFPLLDETRGPYIKLDGGGYQLLLDFHGGPEPFARVTMADVMDRDRAVASSRLVRDRAVILGNAAASVPDAFVTPFDTGLGSGPVVRGIAVHAHVADQLIRLAMGISTQLGAWPRIGEMMWICGWAAGGALLGLGLRSMKWTVSGVVAGLLLLAAVVYEVFGSGFLLPGPPAGLAWVAAAGLTNWVSHAATHREREQLRQIFEHYLDPGLVRQMIRTDAMPQLGGERREISALFTDLADFVKLSETMDPVALGELVNDYFKGVCGAIDAQGGMVTTFSGDGVLALFGAPLDQPDHADHAVAAALAIDAFAREFFALQHDRGIPFGVTRIGVHCGPAMVGNIGSHSRLRYSAVGDVVNTGSRLEGLNKLIGTRVCVSGDVVRKARLHAFRAIGSFVVRGRQEAIEVFEPIDPRLHKPDRLASYNSAFDALRDNETDAVARLAALQAEDPADPLVAFHRRRLAAGESGTLIVMADK
jgi:adenylate cyclase